MNVLLLVLGLLAGVLSGLFGIGGGVIMVTGMVAVLKMPFQQATGTSLGAMLLPVGLLGALEYHRNGNLHIRGAILLSVGLFLGAWVGAKVANDTSPTTVQRLFSVFLLIMAVRMWVKA